MLVHHPKLVILVLHLWWRSDEFIDKSHLVKFGNSRSNSVSTEITDVTKIYATMPQSSQVRTSASLEVLHNLQLKRYKYCKGPQTSWWHCQKGATCTSIKPMTHVKVFCKSRLHSNLTHIGHAPGCTRCIIPKSRNNMIPNYWLQKLRTAKDKVAQLIGDNSDLSSTDQEAAQILGKFFSSVFVQCAWNTYAVGRQVTSYG